MLSGAARARIRASRAIPRLVSDAERDVENVVLKKLLRIWPAAQADGAIRPKVLVNANYLVAKIIPVCDDLAASTERLAREGRTRMAVFFDGLIKVTPPGAIPIVAVIEELSKALDRDFLNARVGGHELARL